MVYWMNLFFKHAVINTKTLINRIILIIEVMDLLRLIIVIPLVVFYSFLRIFSKRLELNNNFT
jgi:hypothetical protein